MTTYKIVTDSSADIHALNNSPFAVAPLKIITAEKEYTDDATLDVEGMVQSLAAYKGRSSTSCPNAEDWIEAFGDAEWVFCVTITGTLSGCYNAACIAKQLYEEQYPERRVFVLDSLSTGPEMRLLIERIEQAVCAGKSFDEVCKEVTAYREKTGLLFMLASMKNLANNGRVRPIVAKAAGLLGIHVVGRASQVGDLEPLCKIRGQDKALAAMVDHLKGCGMIGKVHIAHCMNEKAAQALKTNIEAVWNTAEVNITPCGGLCSFYAEQGGLLVGYETL